MGYNPRDKELTDGRATRKHVEDRPVDNKDRSLMRNDQPQPDWGRRMENELERKRRR